MNSVIQQTIFNGILATQTGGAVKEKFQKRGGYSKSLKKIYLNWVRKQNYNFISGHTELGIAKNFSSDTETVKIFPEWYGSKVSFEYYRRPINKEISS